MNKNTLMSKLQDFFDADQTKRKKSAEDIAEVLQKLKMKHLETKNKLLTCTNDEFKKSLVLEVDVISAQIEKGERLLKELIDNVED